MFVKKLFVLCSARMMLVRTVRSLN